jgi:hypothetical protein
LVVVLFFQRQQEQGALSDLQLAFVNPTESCPKFHQSFFLCCYFAARPSPLRFAALP